jgi:hypothetical protein
MGSLGHKRSYKHGLFLVVIGCIIGGLLFGAFSLTLATLQETSDCPKQHRPDCPIPEKKPIPCPKQKSRPLCPLNAAK